MKVSVNDQELFTLTEIQKKVIQNDIPEEIFDEDMKRRLFLPLDKYQRCLERLKREWMPILSGRFDTLPTNNDELCNLIFSQPDYKNRSVRIQEEVGRAQVNNAETA